MKKSVAILVAGLMAGASVAAPPVADYLTSDIGDPYGAASMQDGRYVQAEKRLTQAYARGARSPELLLNLASLRARSGRGDSAQSLYREVLQQENVSLVTLSGTRMSHDMAQTGLADAGR